MKNDLRLFYVTLPWQQNDPEQGDYSNYAWAKNSDDAVHLVAKEMSTLEGAGCETAKERKQFIADRIAEASPYGQEDVAGSVLQTIRTLMAGPRNKMTKEAERDYERVAAILANYGATP